MARAVEDGERAIQNGCAFNGPFLRSTVIISFGLTKAKVAVALKEARDPQSLFPIEWEIPKVLTLQAR